MSIVPLTILLEKYKKPDFLLRKKLITLDEAGTLLARAWNFGEG